MALSEDITQENQRNYDRLIVALEASLGKLDLLMAVCDDRNLQASLIQRYEAELKQQGVEHYRVLVRRQEPSLRYAIEHLVQQKPALQQGLPAVVTVLGIDDLLPLQLDADRSQLEKLFGYLQWTREAFLLFQFPVVVWWTQAVLAQLAEQAPDFWSWRGGVFWFWQTQPSLVTAKGKIPNSVSELVSPQPQAGLAIHPEISGWLHLIEYIQQQQGQETPLLVGLYERLGKAYTQLGNTRQDRQFAIQAMKRSIALKKKLGLETDLVHRSPGGCPKKRRSAG